jgi:hypothetical protein
MSVHKKFTVINENLYRSDWLKSGGILMPERLELDNEGCKTVVILF